jgi:hypothetical protein
MVYPSGGCSGPQQNSGEGFDGRNSGSHHLFIPPPGIYQVTLAIILPVLRIRDVQGGSDKSGILKIFLENHTAQLKSSEFIKLKKN